MFGTKPHIEKIKNHLSEAVLVYGMIVMLYQMLFLIVPIRTLIAGNRVLSLVSPFLAVLGLLLLAVSVVTTSPHPLHPETLFPRLLILSLIISTFLNRDGMLTDNIKTILWQANLLMLFASCSHVTRKSVPGKENIGKSPYFLHIAEATTVLLLLVWDAAVIYSLKLYFNLEEYTVYYKGNKWHQGLFEGRLHGVFTTPYNAALISCYTMLISFCLLKKGCKRVIPAFSAFSIFLSFTMLVLTGTRSVMLGLILSTAVVIPMYVADKKSLSMHGLKRLLILALIAFAAAVCTTVLIKAYSNLLKLALMFSDGMAHTAVDIQERPNIRGENISSNRFAIWQDYLYVFTRNPKKLLFGYSPCGYAQYIRNTYPDLFIVSYFRHKYPLDYYFGHDIYSAHNAVLTILISTGLVGLVIVAAFLLYILVEVSRHYLRGRFRTADYAALAFFFITIVSIMFESDIFYRCNAVSVSFWMVSGLLFGHCQRKSQLFNQVKHY